MIYNAKDYGILPGGEIAVQLSSLLKIISQDDGEKTLIFEKGSYTISADDCDEKMLYITNTVGDNEFSHGETPHLNKIGLNFQNINNLKVIGNGAEFLIDGKATNVAIESCRNLEIDGITIDVLNPEMHEFTVTKVTAFSVTYSLDSVSCYKADGDRFAFIGKDYETDFYESRATAWWNARLRDGNLCRVGHPFRSALKVTETAPHEFKLNYPMTRRFKVGDRYYIFNTRRQYAGIFVNKSKDITLRNVKQCFNYSLALVCQDTKNITIDHIDFSPRSQNERLVASSADFIQICMCKGQVNVTNSYFCGACDDTINVHGVHYIVKKINGNELTLKYMESQTHSYNPLHEGDEIEFVSTGTLLPKGKAKILTSKLYDDHTILLTVDNTTGLSVGDAVEDITMCPSLYFAGNTTDRIITRNMLITTRNKVIVENNKFLNSTMACILIADDAKNWYESGPVHDAVIRNNYFGQCYAEFIKIMPECGKSTLPVHSNITVTGNTFDSTADKGIYIKCAKDISIKGNTIKNSAVRDNFIKTVQAVNVETE